MSGVPVAELLHAIRFAAEKHRDDRRKGETAAPYINHPITVAEQLAAVGLGSDIELLIAAVLHDVVEDTDTRPEELRKLFGERVTRIVLEVSDDKTLKRRERRAQVVAEIAGKSREAKLVKLSDLIANIHDVIHHPPHWTVEQKTAYLDWAGEVVARLRGTHAELEERLEKLARQAREAIASP